MTTFNWKRCGWLEIVSSDNSALLTGAIGPTKQYCSYHCRDESYKKGLAIACDQEECKNPNRKPGKPQYVTGN